MSQFRYIGPNFHFVKSSKSSLQNIKYLPFFDIEISLITSVYVLSIIPVKFKVRKSK